MQHRRLRRRCIQLVRSLDLPDPFDIGVLCARLGESRRRPIRLAAIALPPESPCGLLVCSTSVDYILYEEQATLMHQTHVIAHELGHLLWGHSSAALALEEPVRKILPPEIDPTLVQRMLGRSQYSEPEEWAAEYFATEVLARIGTVPLEPSPVPVDDADLVSRLERSLDHRHEGRT